jgi:hypothetical protein
MGGGKWQDVDPTWTEPLFRALREGQSTLRLEHMYQNRHGEEVRSWYTIDRSDTSVTQQNDATGKRRELRVVQLLEPRVVEPPADAPEHAPAA